jgi:putative ABC transport system permease protein
MLKDILGQAWEAMLYNRRRTAITMLSMAWGIATVVLLLAYGAGVSRAFEAIFAEWGTNTIGIFPGRTSEQAGGDKAGVKVRLTLDDVDRVSNSVPGISAYFARRLERSDCAERSAHIHLGGGRRPPLLSGHSEAGARPGPLFQRSRGAAARPRLRSRLRSQDQALLGRLGAGRNHSPEWRSLHRCRRAHPKMEEGDNNNVNRIIYVPFNTMSDLKDTMYIDGIWFSYHGDNELAEKSLRETLGAAHHFRPSDHNAVYVANLMTQLKQFSACCPSRCRCCSRWWGRSRWALPASA